MRKEPHQRSAFYFLMSLKNRSGREGKARTQNLSLSELAGICLFPSLPTPRKSKMAAWIAKLGWLVV